VGSGVTFLHPPNLPLPDLVHRLVTLNRPPRRPDLTKVRLSTDSFLDGTVILFQNVVQVWERPMTATPS
jgi:hypothetical protein